MYGLKESFQLQVIKFAQGRPVINFQRKGYNEILKPAAMAFQFGPTYYLSVFSVSSHDFFKTMIQRMDR